MLSPCLDENAGVMKGDHYDLNEDVVELSLLLPVWQLASLKTMAQSRGQTAAQLIRGLVRDFLFENS